MSEDELRDLRDFLDKNLARGFIRPASSAMGAPVIFVRKKDGTRRLCQDYRGLNAIAGGNAYPLPLIPDLLAQLGKGTIFTKLDLREAYYRYMIILLLVFIIQFSVSCACLTLNKDQQSQLLEVAWNNTNTAKQDIERNLNCCGFRNVHKDESCSAACSKGLGCLPCAPIIEEYSGMVLRFVGGIGLFFSFTEILGVWLTYRYRNQKDPRANPSAFL